MRPFSVESRNIFLLVYFLLLLIASPRLLYAQDKNFNKCLLHFSKEIGEHPYGVTPELNSDSHYTYGVEVEYAIKESNENLWLNFAPDESLLPLTSWQNKSLSEKQEWILKNKELLFPDGPKRPSLLKKISSLKELPNYLIIDETGNVELISPYILQNYEDYITYVDFIKNHFGEGYVQSSIRIPANFIFESEGMTDAFLGLRFFMGEFDTLKKLSQAFERYLENPKYTPAKSFTHPFLGPMVNYKSHFLRRVIHHNRVGIIDEDVMNIISKTDVSYKYTGQTVYRPDILRLQEFFLLEIRDCVKDFDCLKRRLLRERFFLSKNLLIFKPFEQVHHLDTIADFNLLPEEIRNMLEIVFPRTLERDDGAEILAAEIYRNFSYPMLDWSSWYDALGIERTEIISGKIKKLQHTYIVELRGIARKLRENKITVEEAGQLVRVSLAKFVYESKITQSMEEWLQKNFIDYDTYKDIL